MIGCGFFEITRDEAQYSSAAYRRDLFRLPIGHIAQFKAISEMQKRGCKEYYIGRYSTLHDEQRPSDKELAISHFKFGFTNRLRPNIYYIKDIEPGDALLPT